MCFLFDLPTVLQALLVCEFLQLADIAQLDSALCCKKLRPDFLALIGSPQCTFSEHVFQSNPCEVRWVIRKNLKFKSILLFANTITDDQLRSKLFARLSGTALESITLSTFNDTDDDSILEKDISKGVEHIVALLIASCPNIESFRIESESEQTIIDDNLLANLVFHCKTLRILELQNCQCGGNVLLRAAYTAPCLESLVLTGCLVQDNVLNIPPTLTNQNICHFNCTRICFLHGTTASVISQVCGHFPNLKSLNATQITNAGLVTISQHCPLLQELTICVSETIREGSATDAACNWVHLRALAIHLTMEPDPSPDDEPDFVGEYSITETAVLSFIRHCPQLTYFNTVCRTHTFAQRYREDTAKNQVVSELEGSQLRELYVESLTVGCFNQIDLLCTRLHLVAIYHEYLNQQEEERSDDLNARPLEMALQYISMSSVKVLHLHNFSDLGESVRYLTGLHEIHFTNSSYGVLTNKDLSDLVSRCPDLTKLVVRNCLPLLDQCPALAH